jgi:hypothetical protein
MKESTADQILRQQPPAVASISIHGPALHKQLRLTLIRNQQTNAKSLDLAFPKFHFPES